MKELEEAFAAAEEADDTVQDGDSKGTAEPDTDTTATEFVAAVADLIEAAPIGDSAANDSDQEAQDADDTGTDAESKPSN